MSYTLEYLQNELNTLKDKLNSTLQSIESNETILENYKKDRDKFSEIIDNLTDQINALVKPKK